jgi:protein-disulfide isomerase
MKMAQCRVEDPGCSVSRGLAGVIADAIKSGKKENEALAAAAASKYTPKLLSPPVLIPTDGAPVTGPANARITLVEFSDFQCPYCAKAVGRIDAVLKAYPTQVRLIFKQFPLSNHPQASISAAAAVAAHQQGKFWEMHNALFANREKLSRKTILELAANLKLDMKRFTTDLDSPQIKEVVKRDAADGDKADVDSTPTVFINGQKYNGSLEFDAIKPVIDAELKTPKKP